MQTFKFVQGNTRVGLRCVVTDPYDGTPIDLGAATVKFYAYTVGGAFAWTANCGVEGNDNNEIVYTPGAADFNTVGTFYGEFYILFGDATEGRIHGFKLEVEIKSGTS